MNFLEVEASRDLPAAAIERLPVSVTLSHVLGYRRGRGRLYRRGKLPRQTDDADLADFIDLTAAGALNLSSQTEQPLGFPRWHARQFPAI